MFDKTIMKSRAIIMICAMIMPRSKQTKLNFGKQWQAIFWTRRERIYAHVLACVRAPEWM